MNFDMSDELRGCEICGNDTTGRLCHSCQQQAMIDDAEPPPPINWEEEGEDFEGGYYLTAREFWELFGDIDTWE